jgi:hypothetical protein
MKMFSFDTNIVKRQFKGKRFGQVHNPGFLPENE